MSNQDDKVLFEEMMRLSALALGRSNQMPRARLIEMARQAGKFDARETHLSTTPGAAPIIIRSRLDSLLLFASDQGVDEADFLTMVASMQLLQRTLEFAWQEGFDGSAFSKSMGVKVGVSPSPDPAAVVLSVIDARGPDYSDYSDYGDSPYSPGEAALVDPYYEEMYGA